MMKVRLQDYMKEITCVSTGHRYINACTFFHYVRQLAKRLNTLYLLIHQYTIYNLRAFIITDIRQLPSESVFYESSRAPKHFSLYTVIYNKQINMLIYL